jgi:predicted CXXCH cytochrome family protein
MKIKLSLRLFISCLFVLLFSAFFLSPALAATDDDCLACHSDKSFSTKRKGRKVSLYVSGQTFSKSIHASMGCVSCHSDADVKDFPHADKLEAVNCGNCHDSAEKQFNSGIHGTVLKRGALYAPKCTSCHGKHNILKSSNPKSQTFKMRVPLLCGKCHKDDAPVAKLYNIPEKNILEHYRDSIHGEGLLKKGLLVTAACTDCHGFHEILPHTNSKSSISVNNVAKTCTKCHGMIKQVHKKVIRGELWEKSPGAIPACVDCHSPHEIRKESLVIGMADKNCLKCHEKKKPLVHKDTLGKSVHRKIPCVKCHSDVSPKHKRPCDTAARVDCSGCHAKQSEEYTESIHGQLNTKKDPDAPYCTDCHGKHDTVTRFEDDSPTFRRNVPMLCAKCHRAGEKAAVRYKGEQTNIIETYKMSTHGKGVIESGLISSAVCIDCHTTHQELPADDPRSSVNPANLAATCSNCHRGIFRKFVTSVHSPSVTKTDKKLPVCADCHSAHKIVRVDKSAFLAQVGYQCGECHKDVSETYFQTYHGKAFQLGSLKAAKCSDCHGSHDILQPGNPASSLSRNNVIETCKKCHPGSNRKFTGYLTHATHHNRYKYPVLFFTFWGMTLLLIGTFAFFGVHTILWLPRSFARFKEKRRMHLSEEKRQFMRFNLTERLLHLSVIISFFGLAITGMMLKFAYMPWAAMLSDLIGGVGVAGVIHRFCALITFGYFGTHFYLLYCYKRDNKLTLKQMIFHKKSLIPNLQDLREFIQTMKWFFGRAERPRYGRWTYWEKFDYLAVFWGVAIIGATGLILWFPEFFTIFLPGWVINVATIIHSDEALLATGFIFTIHFFNTHLRPEAFPMDPVIFTGRIPLTELEHDRPGEYDELKGTDELSQKIVPPISEKKLKWIYVFGMTCLAIGMSLVAMIIYSMLAGYK